MDGFITQKDKYKEEWSFVEDILDLVRAKLSPMGQEKQKTLKFNHPTDLINKINIGLGDDDKIGRNIDLLLDQCEKIVDNSVKTGNPLYFNQLPRGMDPYGLAAAFLLEGLNASIYTYDTAPVLTMIEREVIKETIKLCGWSEGDGRTAPGGVIANMYAVSLARQKFDPEIRKTGLWNRKRLMIFCSEQSHYSTIKAAIFMGMGTDSLVKVRCDDRGAMDPEDLARKIEEVKNSEDSVPFMVWCTGGTTVMHAFDPLKEISKICKLDNLWMHVDGCVGGCCLLSKKYRYFLEGIEEADSLAWNWHKCLGSPNTASIIVTRYPNLFLECHSTSATYLFAEGKHYDRNFDAGDGTIQCGRKADALKIWMIWKARGTHFLGKQIDCTFDSAAYFAEKIKENEPRFKLVVGKSIGPAVCFWVIPPSLLNQKQDEEYWQKLHEVAPELKKKMVNDGTAMVTYQPLPDKHLPNFFRVTLNCHPMTSEQSMDNLIRIFLKLSQDM